MILREGVEILGRHIDADTRYIVGEPLVGQVTAKFHVGNLPVCCVLDLTVAEQVVPSQRTTISQIRTGNVGHIFNDITILVVF